MTGRSPSRSIMAALGCRRPRPATDESGREAGATDDAIQPAPASASWENWFALCLLLFAACWFGWAVSRGWRNSDLPGHEFRQAQTAVSTYWIQHDNDFSLAYPTPVLGKPWSVPLEFPLYQWSVAALASATGWPLIPTARIVSIACLVLALPALWILLRRLGLPPARRALLAALVLTCPVLIFYARAFLIETMALLFALWFVAAFGEAMHTRRIGWLLLANCLGSAAATVKATTFLLYLIPAALWGAWLLGLALRRGGRAAGLPVLLRGLGCVVLPLAATLLWTRFADATKAQNFSGAFLVSSNLTGFNFGLGLFNVRFSAEGWRAILEHTNQAVVAMPVLIAAAALALLFGGRWRRAALASAALFLLAPLLYPLLYTLHDYYFVANSAFLMFAIGFALCGLLDSRRWCWLGGLATVALFAAQAHLFLDSYYRPHLSYNDRPGGTGLTDSLIAFTPPRSVLVIAGSDWSSTIPFFSQRRALMIRRGLERDSAYLARAFADLATEEVGALVLVGDQRTNTALARLAVATFGLDPVPTYRHTTADVYLARPYRDDALLALKAHNTFDQVAFEAAAVPPAAAADTDTVPLGQARTTFSIVSPAPARARTTFGFSISDADGSRILRADPDSDIWIPPPPAATRIHFEFGILVWAYNGDNGPTDGVEFIVDGELPDGSKRTLFYRLLDPAATPADRGDQSMSIEYQPQPGETVVFRTRPGIATAFDWAYWRKIEIK